MNIFIIGELLQILIFENRKNFTLIIQKSGDIAIQSEKKGTVFHTIFYGKDILRKKTSAIRNGKNQSHSPGILTQRGV